VHGLPISLKNKIYGIKGQDPVKSRIVIDNKIIEQVTSFNYLGNLISCEKEVDIDKKLSNCMKITSLINNVFRPQKTLKKARIKLYNTLALPAVIRQ
jgi:hypothetical protein